jgi:hypothetical protein
MDLDPELGIKKPRSAAQREWKDIFFPLLILPHLTYLCSRTPPALSSPTPRSAIQRLLRPRSIVSGLSYTGTPRFVRTHAMRLIRNN